MLGRRLRSGLEPEVVVRLRLDGSLLLGSDGGGDQPVAIASGMKKYFRFPRT